MEFFSNVYFGNTIFAYIKFFGVIIIAVIAGKVVTWITEKFLKSFASKTETKLDDLLLHLLEGPILLSIMIAALYFGRDELVMSPAFAGFYNKMVSVLVIFNVAWYLSRLLAGAIEYYLTPLASKTKSDLDDHLLPILRRLVSIVIFIIAAIMALDKFDYNVGGLLAGLGLGGLAFALAAKDMVGNFFGGIAILTDKPFKLGDRIKVETVEGHVREIGLRSTRVETLAGTLVTIPNSKMVDSILENVTREEARRVVIDLDVEYDTTVKKLEEAKSIIRKHVKRIDGLKDECTVAFSEFGPHSLKIKVIFWITKQGLERFWPVQDELYTAIKRDFEKAKIEFAYPTQTIRVKK